MSSKVPFIVGCVFLKSSLTLEDVGKILSDNIFGGLQFRGRDMEIHEEVPAIFIQSPIIGLKVVLDEYADDEIHGFNLSIAPWTDIEGVKYENVRLDNYLFHLLKTTLKNVSNIEVLEDY